MAVIKLTDQTLIPYKPLQNVAQVNDALVTYAANGTITEGLNAIKALMLATIAAPAKPCVQCGGTGKISAGVTICPLCLGMTQTTGQYTVSQQLIGYNTPA